MNRRLIIGIIVVGAITFVAWTFGYQRMYANPRAELLAELSTFESRIEGYEQILAGSDRLRERERALRERMLGGRADELVHTVRVAVRQLGLAGGLFEPSVSVTTPESARPIPNPYPESGRLGRTPQGRVLKETPGFGVLRAELTGAGSYESVINTLMLAESQPWIHRIDAVTIEPASAEATAFELRCLLWFVWVPEGGKLGAEQMAVRPVSERAQRIGARLTGTNPFRYDPPPPPPKPEPVPEPSQPEQRPPPPPPPPPPYGEWRLWGVIETSRGTEAGLVNTRTKESVRLTPGARVEIRPGGPAARFVGGSGEVARFEIEGQEFEVRLNQTLADRRPVEPRPSG